MTRPLPQTIGRYQIESLLGRGGMGEVYKAFDPSLERTVAIKTIVPGDDNPLFLDRLYREAKACGRLRHPNIVIFYDLVESEHMVFIAMEYLQGESLSATMKRDTLSPTEKLTILVQILDALQYAHSEKVIHRDIKPSNVHLMPDHSVKLLDFGLARLLQDKSQQQSVILGTPHYMSPEQVEGQAIDGRTDVYSTGVLAYEMLTGRRAFDGDTVSSVILQVITQPPPPMATSLSRDYPEIERMIARAMAKSAADRYTTAGEMRDELAAFLASWPSAAAGRADEPTLPLRPVTPPAPSGDRAAADSSPARPAAGGSPIVTPSPAPKPEPPLVKAPPPLVASQVPQPVFTRPTSRRRGRWVGASAIVMGVFLVVFLMAGGPTSPADPARVLPQVPAGPPPVIDPVTTADPKPGGGQSSTPSGPAAGKPPSIQLPPGPRPAPTVQREARSVYLDSADMDAALRAELVEALKARGLTPVTRKESALIELTGSVQISLRPSPFSGSSGLTADYVATFEWRDLASGSNDAKRVDGHAMEFGEAVVRRAALRGAAEQAADAIEKTIAK